MVYRGKPSEACESCRKRRIKCDKKQPSCTQCFKKSILCKGYRDQLGLSFQDETTTVILKCQTRQSQRDIPRQVQKSSTYKLATSHLPNILSDLSCPLTQPIHDAAIAHFQLIYAPESRFEYLTSYYTQAPSNTPFEAATCAAALANLSCERREPGMMEVARNFYSQALAQINAALKSQDALLDSTLASIILLSLFETIAVEDETSGEGWNSHTEGAMSLIYLRGLQQLQTEMGRNMYTHVSKNIRVSYAQRAQPLSAKFIELDAQATQLMDYGFTHTHFWSIINDFNNLHIMETKGHHFERSERLHLALEIENKALSMLEIAQNIWPYTVLDSQDAPSEAFESSAHCYLDHANVRTWNTLRMIRIFVNELIHDHASEMLKTMDPIDHSPWSLLRESAVQASLDMGSDILASVPQFVRRAISEQGEPVRTTIVSGFIWPLSAVARSALLSSNAKQYARETLCIIGTERGLPQAIKIAEKLEDGKIPPQWLHMFHLI